jgi:uncharacterized membrane protein YedE/YeeE
MTEFTPVSGALGGALIGLSAVILMAGLGRIAGVSGIFASVISGQALSERGWRLLFLAGLLIGTALTALLGGFDAGSIAFPGNPVTTIIGGLLVGAGTALGSGCTSGHGICGISRLSPRSISSTLMFMAVAVATVYLMRHVIGG